MQQSLFFSKRKPVVSHEDDWLRHNFHSATYSVGAVAWVILALLVAFTFVGFMTIDPDPSVLLSACAAANCGLMVWAMYRLYSWDLLLSPMMIMFVGPTMFLYYTWGNLGSRAAGNNRFAANVGTLQFYPQVALLSTVGLVIFCWIIFGPLRKPLRRNPVGLKYLFWEPRQIVLCVIVILVLLGYLSVKYRFTGGYFRGAEADFDRWLIGTVNALVFLLAIISSSVLVRAATRSALVSGTVGAGVAVIFGLGLRSRTFMLMVVILIGLCCVTLKPGLARAAVFWKILLAGIVLFGLGTAVKQLQGESSSIIENLLGVSSMAPSEIVDIASTGVRIDRQYRTAGFEYPAAILRSFDLGARPAYGEGIFGAALQGLPGFARPDGDYSERGNLARHFWKTYRFYDEAMAIPLVSGLGDWGIPGVMIYFVMGPFCLVLWRIAQRSPRLFVAYLSTPMFPDSLFWDGVFTYAKTMTFLWILLAICGPIFMPRVIIGKREN